MRIIELSNSNNDRQSYHRRGFSSSRSSTPRIKQITNTTFLNEVLGIPKKTHYVSRIALNQAEPIEGSPFEVATVSQLVQATHQAFAEHVPLSLNPDVFWYAIVHEIAILIKSNPTKYADLFTTSPQQQKLIEVRDDSLVYDGENDWLGSINLIRDPLAENMAEFSRQLFLPTFSTTTPESETAILVSFMDVISKYYKFQWTTRCGIPKIRLEGEAIDWTKLLTQTNSLSEVFTDLESFFNDLIPVLQIIARTANGDSIDEKFWSSFYKYNDESGGDTVSGWITALSAYKQTSKGFQLKEKFDWQNEIQRGYGGIATNHFSSHVSKVPFIWDYYGSKIPMFFVAGVIGVDYDEFLNPRLGFGVYEE